MFDMLLGRTTARLGRRFAKRAASRFDLGESAPRDDYRITANSGSATDAARKSPISSILLSAILRVSRITAVYSAGRIVNPRTERSQMTGGLIWARTDRNVTPGESMLLLKRLARIAGFLTSWWATGP